MFNILKNSMDYYTVTSNIIGLFIKFKRINVIYY